MSEELIQRNLVSAPEYMGPWDYYNIGATTLKALKAAKIIPKRDYAEFETKKPDALIVKKPIVVAAIEYKQPSKLKTKKQIETAIQQEIGTAQALNAKIYIVTDGKKTFWINPLTGNHILSDSGEPVSLPFNQHSEECVKLISKALSSISKNNDTLLAASVVDPLPLAQQAWQDLWAVSGATPENCLYTFVEIFIFKYLSDLSILPGMYSFGNLLSQYNSNSNNEVLEYYATFVRPKIRELFPGNLKDKTTIINGTIFVSKDDKAVDGYAVVFRKILERFEKFGTLESIDYDFKSKLFETFLKESISKKNWGQFFTPLKVVRSIVNMADIRPGMSICDPACGVGKFLLEPILHDISRYYKIEGDKIIPQIILSGFDKGFDKDEQKTIILAKANMLIYLSTLIRENSHMTIDFAKLFNDTFLLQTNSILGTLAHPTENAYDLILTNPPYVMSGSSNLKDEIAKQDTLKRYFSINAMGIEGLFMEWVVRALKPGGKAFVVVPDGIMSRSNDKRLRDFILQECDIDAVISLPINTFFTTNKKTYILAITKKIPVLHEGIEGKERQTTSVFTYLCSEIGETRDTYRFDMEQNDLAEAAGLFNMFKGARDYFRTEDKRCKVVNIDEFYNGIHWSVERWWTREECIELDIEEEAESITPEEMGALVGDIANTLLQYQDMFVLGSQKKKNEVAHIEISITDDRYFDYISAAQLGKTKTELVKLKKGEIPVFTAAQEPIMFIERQSKAPIEATIDNPILSFANDGDGSAGRNFVFHTSEFYINASRTALRTIDVSLSLRYVHQAISDMKSKYKFSYAFKANKQNLAYVMLRVPINEKGLFDLDAQNAIVEQYELIEQLKAEIKSKREQIESVFINLNRAEETCTSRCVKLTDKSLFSLITKGIGENRSTLKVLDTQDETNIPVFTAGIEPAAFVLPFLGKPLIEASETAPILSFATNGDGSAGRNFVLHKRPFYINADRIAVKTLDNHILPDYLLSQLYDMKRKYKFSHSYKANKHNLQAVSINIPIDIEGNLCVDAQREIADAYTAIEQYRREIIDKLDMLLSQRIEY